MDVIQLLITIVVVTILITIALAVVTYVAYKLRLAREPSALDRAGDGPRYFVRYDAPGLTPASGSAEPGAQMTAGPEGHAPEA